MKPERPGQTENRILREPIRELCAIARAERHVVPMLEKASNQYLGNVDRSQSTNPYQPSYLLMVPDA